MTITACNPNDLSLPHTLNDIASDRVAFLDYGRGIAILGVIAVHTVNHFGTGHAWLNFLISCGQFGVQLFFVISAYTMCMTLEQRVDRETYPMVKFWIRRFSRLALPFWCAIILYLWFRAIGSPYFASQSAGWIEIVSSALLMQGFWPTTFSSVVPGGGSIATEAAFYLLFPLLFYIRRNLTAIAILGVAVVIADYYAIRPYYANLFAAVGGVSPYDAKQFFHYYIGKQLPVFMLGIVAYELVRRGFGCSKRDAFTLGLWSIVFLAFSSFIAVVGIAAALGLLVLRYMTTKTSLITGWLGWFGRHSYSLYLFHFAVLNLTMTLADRAGGLGNGLWVFGAAFVLVTILSALVATVTKPLLEDRGTAMGRALVSWLTTTPHTVRRNAG